MNSKNEQTLKAMKGPTSDKLMVSVLEDVLTWGVSLARRVMKGTASGGTDR